jgi:hypothetical protein
MIEGGEDYELTYYSFVQSIQSSQSPFFKKSDSVISTVVAVITAMMGESKKKDINQSSSSHHQLQSFFAFSFSLLPFSSPAVGSLHPLPQSFLKLRITLVAVPKQTSLVLRVPQQTPTSSPVQLYTTATAT